MTLYKHQDFFGQLKLLNKQNLTYVNKYLHMINIQLSKDYRKVAWIRRLGVQISLILLHKSMVLQKNTIEIDVKGTLFLQ